MKKSRPKTSMRPSSAVKDKMSYQSAKKITLTGDKGNSNFVILQKTSLLPILNTYQPRILKHIIITDEKITLSNHKNCEIHSIGIKTIISYFIEWKKTIIRNLKQFETVLCGIEEGNVKKVRKQLVNIVQNVRSVNDIIGKKLQKYIMQQAQHYISQRLQSHKQHPPNKPQPLAKQSNNILSQNNYNKLQTILTDYRYLKQLTQAILDIFNTLQKVLRINIKEEKNDDDMGGIVFQDVEIVLLMGNYNGKDSRNINNNMAEVIGEYISKVSNQLWQIVDKKITQAFTLCNARSDIGFMDQFIQDNSNQTPSGKGTKNFMVMERLAKTSKQSAKLSSKVEYLQPICKKSFKSTNKIQYTYSNLKSSSASKTINLNLVQFRLKKLFPLLIQSVIQQIEDILKYRNIMSKYAEYLSKVVMQLNKYLSIQYQYHNSQDQRVGGNGSKRLLKIEKRYNNLQSMIGLLLVQVGKYKQQMSSISSAVEEMRKGKDQQQILTFNKILSKSNQQQVSKLIQYLRAALQLYFYQFMDGSLKEIELQQSVLELIKDQGKVYKWVKECLGLMITVGMEDFNVELTGRQQGDRDVNNVNNTKNKGRVMSTSQWTSFLTQCSRSYSTLLTTIISLPNEITLLCRQNSIKITQQHQDKSYYDQTIKYFDNIVQVLEEFLSIRQKVIKELRQKLINRRFVDRVKENAVMMSGRQVGSRMLEEIHKQLKQNIQYTVVKLTPQQKQLHQLKEISSQQLSKEQQCQQLRVIRQFVQLIKSSQQDIQSMTLFNNPQSYLSSLTSTGNQLLTHPRLLTDISTLTKQYKQYMNILCGSELVQYVIKESQVKDLLIGKVVDSQIGFVLRDRRGERGSQNEVFQKITQQVQSQQLAFPKVPIILNPPQHHPLNNSNSYNSNPKATIPISQILNTKLPITSYPIIQKTRLKALQLHKMVGDTIDNLEEMKQMEKFNQQLRQDIEKLKGVVSGEVIVRLVNEMVRMVVREWGEMIKRNQFVKRIKLNQLMKIIHLLQDKDENEYDPTSIQQRQTIKLHTQYLKQLLSSLQQTNNQSQQQSTNVSINNNKANKNIELLSDMIKSLQLRRFVELRMKLKQFLEENGILIVQYDMGMSVEMGQQQFEVHKYNVSGVRRGRQLVDQKKKRSKLIILLKKVKKSKRINLKQSPFEQKKQSSNILLRLGLNNINQSQQQKESINENNDDRINVMLILRKIDTNGFLSKVLPKKIMSLFDVNDKNNNNKYRDFISKDDLEYMQYHYTQIQLYIKEFIDKLQSFRKSKQQQPLDVLFKQVIDEINKQIGSFSILLAKIIMGCWLKQRVQDDNDVVKSGWGSELLLIKIQSLFERACVDIVRECMIKKKIRSYVRTDSSNKNKFHFNSSMNSIQQEDNFIKILRCNSEQQQQKQTAQNEISPQTLHNIYQQIANVIEFLSWYQLRKNTNYQLVKLSQIVDNSRQQLLVYWCVLNKTMRKVVDINKRKQSLLEVIQSCRLFTQSINPAKQKQNNQHHIYEQSSGYYNQLPHSQMLKLSLLYQQSCCNISEQMTEVQSTQNDYYHITTISVQKLLQQFILRSLIVENGLMMTVRYDNGELMSNGIQSKCNSVNSMVMRMINQLNAVGVRTKTRGNHTGKSNVIHMRNKILPQTINEFANNIHCAQYFYYHHYRKFTNYLIQIQRNNNHQTNLDKTQSIHQTIAIKVQELINIWTRIEAFPLFNEGVDINHMPIDGVISQLYQIIRQLIIKETELVSIGMIKQIIGDVNNDKWLMISIKDSDGKRDNMSKDIMIGMLLLPLTNQIIDNPNNTQNTLQHHNQNHLLQTTTLSYYQQIILQRYFWSCQQSRNSNNMQLLLQQPYIRQRFIELFNSAVKYNVKQQLMMIKQIEFKVESRFIILDLFPIIQQKQLKKTQYQAIKTVKTITMIQQYKQKLCEYGKSYYDIQKGKQQISKLIYQIDQLIQYVEWKRNIVNGEQYIYVDASKSINRDKMRQYSGQMQVLLESISIAVKKQGESIQIYQQHDESLFGTNNGLLLQTPSNNNVFKRVNKQLIQQLKSRNQTNDNEGLKLIELQSGFQLVSKRHSQYANNNTLDKFFKERNHKSENSQCWHSDKSLIKQLDKMKENALGYLQFIQSKQCDSKGSSSLFIQRLLNYLFLTKANGTTNNNQANDCAMWWSKLMFNTICLLTNKQQQSQNTQHIVVVSQPLLFTDSINKNRIRKYIDCELQQIQQRINDKQWSKDNNQHSQTITTMQEVNEQVEIFISLAEKTICQLQQQMTTKVFIQLPQSQRLYNDGLMSVKHQIMAQGGSTATTTNCIELSSNTYQIEIDAPFNLISGKWTEGQNNNYLKSTTKHELLTRVFTHFIIEQQILQHSRIKQINQLKQQLSTHTNTLLDQIKNVYTQIPTKEKQLIVEWSDNKIEHEKQVREEANKQYAFEILFDVLIKWAELIQKERSILIEKQKNDLLQQQQKRLHQQQQFIRTQDNNNRKKPKLLQSSSSQLQIQFALSDAWGVDYIEFIDNLNNQQREKFYRIEKQISQNKQQRNRNNQLKRNIKNDKSIKVNDNESQLQISVNLSENYADIYEDHLNSGMIAKTLTDYKDRFSKYQRK